MHKKVIFLSLSLLFISALIFFTTAQSVENDSNTLQDHSDFRLVNKGSNFETLCNPNGLCNTTIYSYDKYFDRGGNFEEIDESWHSCEEGFCTNDYYFQATANQEGIVTIESDGNELSQTLNSFTDEALSFSTISIQGSVLTYENIIPNVDLRYQYLPHKLKEEFIIKQPIQIPLDSDLTFDFVLSGNLDYSLDKPFICDSNRNCLSFDYNLQDNQISLVIPREFLDRVDLVYPLIIDPAYGLGDSAIIWNGVIEDLGSNKFNRTHNPQTFEIGQTLNGVAYADIDWNLESFPKIGRIDNVYLALFIEGFTAPNELNIIAVDPENSSTYPDDDEGNSKLFELIKFGHVYSTAYSPIPLYNFTYYFQFDSNGLTDLRSALSSDKRFSTGINTYDTERMAVSARDHPNAIQRPVLILQHSPEEFNLTYDANGNMIQGFGKYMEYDGWNRLSRIRNVSSTGIILAEYFYDHEGNRIKKIVYGVNSQGHNESTYYMNTRPADFIQVVNTNGTVINETYIYLQDKLIAKIDTKNRKFFYHPDHLGSTTLVTNESGAVVEDLLYLPYGEVLFGDEISRYGYTGQENDLESGFMDYGARQYNPQFGRFLQPDPIITDVYNPQNLNRYAYVLNNPYKYVDPTGMIVEVVTRSLNYEGNGLVQLAIRNGPATHSYFDISPDNPEDFTDLGSNFQLGAGPENGMLKSRFNQDKVDAKEYSRVILETPEGKTDTEFIRDLMVEATKVDELKVNYAAIPEFSKDGENSNSFVSTLITNTKSRLPDGSSYQSLNPYGSLFSAGLGRKINEEGSNKRKSSNSPGSSFSSNGGNNYQSTSGGCGVFMTCY